MRLPCVCVVLAAFQVVSSFAKLGGEEFLFDSDLFGRQVPETEKGNKKCDKTCPAKVEYEATENRAMLLNEGLGESPGVSGIEYLGVGYNIFLGNPRGSLSSELDPGFRSRVIHLEQKQSELTPDQAYMMPLGTEIRSVSSCEFQSSSTVLSSVSQFQRQLSREVSQSYSAGGSGTGATSKGPISVSAEFSFSQSEKVTEFKQRSVQKQSVALESRALCLEFEAKMLPYYNHTPTLSFKEGLATLPAPYDFSLETQGIYRKFIESFGTHFVDRATLGAKHIFTSSIKAQDVLDLRKDSIDVSSEVSLQVQADWGSQSRTGSDLKGDSGPDGEVTVNVYTGSEKNDDDTPGPPQSGASINFSTEETRSSSGRSERLDRIRSKVIETTEVNVGGVPPVDGNWKTWASSVRDSPMPVMYSMTGLWELMEEDVADAFFEAFKDIYGFDLDAQKPNDKYLRALHFGVSDQYGTLYSTYSSNPSSDYRSIIEAGKIGALVSEDVEEVVVAEEPAPVSDSVFGEFVRSGKPGFRHYLCGMQLKVDTGEGALDDEGVTGVQSKYCSIDDWDEQVVVTVKDTNYGGWQGMKTCPSGTFVVGGQASVEFVSDDRSDPRGIIGLTLKCSNVKNAERGLDPTDIEIHDEEGDNKRTLGLQSSPSPNAYVTGVAVQFGLSDGNDDSGEFTAVEGLKFEFKPVLNGPVSDIWTYKVLWDGSQSVTHPIFGLPVRDSVAANLQEDNDEPGFLAKNDEGKYVLNVESAAVFGLFDPLQPATGKSRLAIHDFKGTSSEANLPLFTFMVVENLPSDNLFRPGVVDPLGNIQNEVFGSNVGFDISLINDHEYVVTFDPPFNGTPTFVASPVWFLERTKTDYPDHLGQVSVLAKSCDSSKCRVSVGSRIKEGGVFVDTPHSNLGFSFLAIDPHVTTSVTDGMIHGSFAVAGATTQVGDGYTLTQNYKSMSFEYMFGEKNEKTMTTDVPVGGVKIEFTEPFLGKPSVMASPISVADDLTHDEKDIDMNMGLSHVVVEHLSDKSVFIKCVWVSIGTDGHIYKPLDFNFVVVGPVKAKKPA